MGERMATRVLDFVPISLARHSSNPGTNMLGPITGDPRFFARRGPFPIARVAETAGGISKAEPLLLTGIAPLQLAGPSEVSFLDNRRYAAALESTSAGAVILHPDMLDRLPAGTLPILTRTPYEGRARVASLFHPVPPMIPGVHPTAFVSEGALVASSAQIGPFAFIGTGAEIGPDTVVGSHVTIGEGVVIGADCRIGAQASLSHSVVGRRVYVYPGARIGQEGFSFASTSSGFLSVPQLGRVLIDDDVEIGANTTIDRGSARDTVIGAGSRLDNLVQIGHNVQIGRCCVIVAQVGIAGSTTLDDFVQIGGQAAINGHLRISKGAKIGAQAGVISDLPPGAAVLGSPAQPRRDFLRQVARAKRCN
jgi:UDP-3-O-[3-hydroxymyristoyl] glucosamine N-acyltransferase